MNQPAGPKKFGGKTIGAVAVAFLIGAYSLARPVINQQMGWSLPEVRQNADGQVLANQTGNSQKSTSNRTADPKTKTQSNPKATGDTTKSSTKPPAETKPGISKKAGPLASRMRASGDSKKPTLNKSGTSSKPTDDPNLKYGLLRDLGNERYISPAGLMYTKGSAEGHRLEHLRRHTKDNPGRPGSHGVFDGEMDGALKTIDLAYEKAKKGVRTTKKTDRDRTIYTIDMGKRVGFVGGKDGNRRRKPMARRVRLVLEGTRVITAYPM